jgi:hypothetical protein
MLNAQYLLTRREGMRRGDDIEIACMDVSLKRVFRDLEADG